MTTKKLPPNGILVRAKPAGWNEKLTAAEEFDTEPRDWDGLDIEGILNVSVVPKSQYHNEMVVCLVGGLEADINTVEVIK